MTQASLEELERRIAIGQTYTAAHPDDERAHLKLQRYIDEHAALCARLVCALDLPEHIRWSRTRDLRTFSRVRVVLHGECEQENDVTRDDLKALLESVDLAREAGGR